MNFGTLEIFSVLSNADFRKVFLEILTSRIKSRYQLEIDSNINKASVEDALNSLQKAGLIHKQAAAYKEWDAFCPTEKGFSAKKLLNHYE
jgi:predicted transcriptional regulator